MDARHIILTGRVQGVGFRWFTMNRAGAMDLSGWVRNNNDGSLEVWVEGPEFLLDAFENDLREGPPGASVRNCESRPVAATGRYTGFHVTY